MIPPFIELTLCLVLFFASAIIYNSFFASFAYPIKDKIPSYDLLVPSARIGCQAAYLLPIPLILNIYIYNFLFNPIIINLVSFIAFIIPFK